jgi:hypothetical protein
VTRYIKAPLSELGVLEKTEELRTVELRAHATELLYGDAAHLQGLAAEQWPDLDWRIEHVRTGRYIVKGKPKLR